MFDTQIISYKYMFSGSNNYEVKNITYVQEGAT